MEKLILLLFLVSCGDIKDMIYKKTPAPAPKSSNAELLTYVEKFERLYGINVTVPVNFKDIEHGRAGVCYLWSSGYAEIEIDPDFWQTFTEEQREQLVFHELGHCVFKRQHDNTTTDNCPTSVMRSYMFNTLEIYQCYLPRYEYYIDELQ